MAMKFVKNNIHNFGGDPNNVTLIGHSSGGISVNWHCVSELSKGRITEISLELFSNHLHLPGLFHRAIILSGSILTDSTFVPQTQNWPLRLAQKLGYAGSDEDKDVLEFLQQADPVRLTEEQQKIMQPEDKVWLAFTPHIEPYITDTTFIAQNPIGLLEKAWSKDIDIITGSTSHERFALPDPKILSEFNLESLISEKFNLDADDPKLADMLERTRMVYFPKTDPKEDFDGYFRVRRFLNN